MSAHLTFPKGGVHPPEAKELTEKLAVETMPLPAELELILGQHIGAPCTPVVKRKEEGTIQLTLRNPLDNLVAEEKEPEAAPAPKAPVIKRAPRRNTEVTIIRGTRVEKKKAKT